MITMLTPCLYVSGERQPLSKLPPMDANNRNQYTDKEWSELAEAWEKEAPELFDAARTVRDYFGDGVKLVYIGPIRGEE